MKFAFLPLVLIGLAGCNQASRGPYASAGNYQSWALLPTGYQTITDPRGYTCGPDINVCHYETRDRRDRGQ
jgi:hypothetical protein